MAQVYQISIHNHILLKQYEMFKRHVNWHFHADVRIYIVIDANCQVDQEVAVWLTLMLALLHGSN